MEIIMGSRGSGKTVRTIKLCQQLNKEAGHNVTVIVVRDHPTACSVKKLAEDLGYPDMPFPCTFDEIFHKPATWYKKILIDDLDALIQQMAFPWEVAGYSITYPLDNVGGLV